MVPADRSGRGAGTDGAGADVMPTTLKTAAESYLRAKALSRGTRNEYLSTLRKWERWGGGMPDRATAAQGHPRVPRLGLRAGRQGRGDEPRPHGQQGPRAPPRRPLLGLGAGADRRAAAVPRAQGPARRRRPPLPDQGRDQRPLLRHPRDGAAAGLGRPSSDRPVLAQPPWSCSSTTASIPGPSGSPRRPTSRSSGGTSSWDRQSPDREVKERSPWGWLFYRRVKTGKAFYRPMNRVVHAHLRSIMPEDPRPDAPVFLGGGARPNARFQALCGLAGIKPRLDIETGEEEPWELKDLRKTCATYYDEHVPESSVEILGHSVGGITYRHYAHRAPLAFRAIMTLPQPTAFSAILRGGRQRVPVLPEAVRRRRLIRSISTESGAMRARVKAGFRTPPVPIA